MNAITETPTAALARCIEPLEASKAAIVRGQFSAMFDAVDRWQAAAKTLVVTSEEQTHTMKTARALRLEIKAARVELDKRRKAMKEGIVREGRAIDGAFNIFVSLSEPLEAHLLEQEEFAKRAEAKRRDALRDARTDALQALGVPSVALPAELGALTEEEWLCIVTDAREAKTMREERARLEEEARVEAARIVAQRETEARAQRAKEEADRKVREAEQRAENERLRAIAAEKEAETRARLEAEAKERRRVEEETNAVIRRQEETLWEAERERERVAREKAEAEAEYLRAQLEAAHAANDVKDVSWREYGAGDDSRRDGTTSAPDGKPVPVQTADRPSYGLSAAEDGESGSVKRDGGRSTDLADDPPMLDSEERLGLSHALPNGSASANERTISCPAWLSFPHVYRSTKYADRGHDVHGYQRDILAGVAQEIALAKLPEALRETCKRIDWRKLCGDLDEIATEASYALDVRARTARFLGTSLGRDYAGAARRLGHPLGPWEIPGSLDITGRRRSDHLRVVADLKSGFQDVTEAESNAQGLFFASVFMLLEGEDHVMIRMAKLKPNGDIWNDVATFGSLDVDEYMDQLEAGLDLAKVNRRVYLAGHTPDVYPGDHCQYCPSFDACPAKTALASSMLSDLTTIRGRVHAMTQVEKGAAWEKAHDGVAPVLKVVLEALKESARAEPIPLSNGYEVREAPYDKAQTDFEAAVALARELGATDAQIATCSRTITVRPVVARKVGGPTRRKRT